MTRLVNLIGKKFGTVTITAQAESDTRGHTRWIGKCDCGSVRTYNKANIPRIKRCGECRTDGPEPKDACGRGHKYTSENAYVDKWGRRHCRACKVIITQKRDQDKKSRRKSRMATKKFVAKQRSIDPNYNRDCHLRSTYGISYADYQQMFEKQSGKCFLCDKPPSENHPLHVDHCHETYTIRKLLCFTCNSGLGIFKDSPELLRKAAEYIEDFRKETKCLSATA